MSRVSRLRSRRSALKSRPLGRAVARPHKDTIAVTNSALRKSIVFIFPLLLNFSNLVLLSRVVLASFRSAFEEAGGEKAPFHSTCRSGGFFAANPLPTPLDAESGRPDEIFVTLERAFWRG